MPNEIYHKSNWGNANAEGFGDVYFDAAATNKLYNHSDYYENSDGTDKILRDLSNKASIVLTPTAYSDGSLNTVIPPYAPSYINNIPFVTSEWGSLQEGWSIDEANNKLVAEATWTGINKTATFGGFGDYVGKTVKVSFDAVVTAGSFDIYRPFITSNISESGSYSFTKTSVDGRLRFRNRSTDFAGEITNIKFEVIEEADFDFSRGSSATRLNEQGLIESIASGLPRIDYTSGFGSLLLEPQRQNSYNYSEPTSNEGTSSGTTYESFDWSLGFTNCVRFGDNSVIRFRYGASVAASTQYTISAFVIMDDLSEPEPSTSSILGDFSFVVGGSTSGTVNQNISYGNNIYKVSATITSGTKANNNGIVKYTTQSSKGFRVVGWQVEQGSYATSYIVSNSGSATTRSADVANNSGNADLFNDSEGVLYAEISALANYNTQRWLSLSDSTHSNVVKIGLLNSATDFRFAIEVRSGGSTQAFMTYNFGAVTPTMTKIAIKFKQNDFALWVNGVERATDTSGNTPTGLSELSFDRGDGGQDFEGNVKCVAVFKEALTDAELQQLTS